MAIARVCQALGLACLLVSLAGCRSSAPTGPSSATHSGATGAFGALSAKELLAASERAYKELRTYRDSSTLTQVLEQTPPITTTQSFETAFERGVRVRWQLWHGFEPGDPPSQRLTVWSMDGRKFSYYSTSSLRAGDDRALSGALNGTRSIGSLGPGVVGASRLILPLLDTTDPSAQVESILGAFWFSVQDGGHETIDGVDCRKVVVYRSVGGETTAYFWFGPDLLLRRVRQEVTVVPTREDSSSTYRRPYLSKTTVDIRPVANEEHIDDALFVPNEK